MLHIACILLLRLWVLVLTTEVPWLKAELYIRSFDERLRRTDRRILFSREPNKTVNPSLTRGNVGKVEITTSYYFTKCIQIYLTWFYSHKPGILIISSCNKSQKSRGSSVGIATSYGLGKFLFSTASRPARSPPSPLSDEYRRLFPQG